MRSELRSSGAMADDARPDPDELLRASSEEEQRAARGKLDDLLRRGAGRRQDLRDARGGAHRAEDEARRRDRRRRDARPPDTGRAPHRPRAPAAARGRAPRRHARGVRPRRGPRAQAAAASWSTSSRTPTRPGSRHAKRWQDVEELLDAGIDVYTTLNVQHLESLNDVVAQITGVIVRETVPDAVFEQADEVRLIDLPADELLERLREGKVYIPEQARRAIENFFREGQPHRAARARAAPHGRARRRADARLQGRARYRGDLASGERVLVCVGPSPARRARPRGAAHGGQPAGGAGSASTSRRRRRCACPTPIASASANLRLAEQLGAEPVTLSGEDAAEERSATRASAT